MRLVLDIDLLLSCVGLFPNANLTFPSWLSPRIAGADTEDGLRLVRVGAFDVDTVEYLLSSAPKGDPEERFDAVAISAFPEEVQWALGGLFDEFGGILDNAY